MARNFFGLEKPGKSIWEKVAASLQRAASKPHRPRIRRRRIWNTSPEETHEPLKERPKPSVVR